MKSVLIFGGTTEGRTLAELLAENRISSHVCVATEYGEMVMEASEFIHLHMGRLNQEEMVSLMKAYDLALVVDATHPFASLVSETIGLAVEEVRKERESRGMQDSFSFYRLERPIQATRDPSFIYCSDAADCANKLKTRLNDKIKGKEKCEIGEGPERILLTTGSKDLKIFCQEPKLCKHLMARVLPGMESISLCYQAGLEGKQILAMQGPFSVEMNLAQIKEYQITALVTKDTGKTGGTDTKLEAVRQAGIDCYVIRKPEAEQKQASFTYDKKYTSVKELAESLSLDFDRKLQETDRKPQKTDREKEMKISLVGIGMGNPNSLTMEAKDKIYNADYIFGAERMLASIDAKGEKYPYYLSKDIIPILEKLIQEEAGALTVAILFSGDCGFFSGATKMRRDLQEHFGNRISTESLPGISSMVALSAKLGCSWQDAGIVSMHGVSQEEWEIKLRSKLSDHEQIFFLTSGKEDLHKLGKLLMEEMEGNQNLSFELGVGYQLSYENEELLWLSPEECLEVEKEGLYCGMLWKKEKSSCQ